MKQIDALMVFYDYDQLQTKDDILLQINMNLRCIETYYSHMHLTTNTGVVTVGNEFLLGLTKTLLTSIGNTIFWISNNAKTFFKSYRALKRSELREYMESQKVTHMRILHLDYADVRDKSMPIPRGMRGTYLDAATSIDKLLAALDMSRKSAAALAIVETLHKELLYIWAQEDKATRTADANTVSQHKTGAAKLFDIKQLERIKVPYDKIFTKQQTDDVRFDAIYKSMQEFKQTDDLLLDMESYLISVSSVASNLEKIEEYFLKIVEMVNKKQVVFSKDALQSLAHISLMFAQCFDLYGDACETLTRVEHNYVVGLRVLEKVL
jgi:hypothetical protein